MAPDLSAYDLTRFNGPDWKREASDGGVGKRKPQANRRAKASGARWAEIRAKKCQECRCCGAQSRAGVYIHGHHLILKGSGLWPSIDTENNVVGLCASCHTDFHAGKDSVKKILRARLTVSEVKYTDKTAYPGYVDDHYWRLREAGRNPGTLKEDE